MGAKMDMHFVFALESLQFDRTTIMKAFIAASEPLLGRPATFMILDYARGTQYDDTFCLDLMDCADLTEFEFFFVYPETHGRGCVGTSSERESVTFTLCLAEEAQPPDAMISTFARLWDELEMFSPSLAVAGVELEVDGDAALLFKRPSEFFAALDLCEAVILRGGTEGAESSQSTVRGGVLTVKQASTI